MIKRYFEFKKYKFHELSYNYDSYIEPDPNFNDTYIDHDRPNLNMYTEEKEYNTIQNIPNLE